jgi:hypothetical protein
MGADTDSVKTGHPIPLPDGDKEAKTFCSIRHHNTDF